MARKYSKINEAAAHIASAMSHPRKSIPHAGCPDVSAIAAGMNEIREKPRTKPDNTGQVHDVGESCAPLRRERLTQPGDQLEHVSVLSRVQKVHADTDDLRVRRAYPAQ